MKRNKQKALYLAGALVATASLGFASPDAHADSLEEATVSTSETSATVTADQVATAKTEAKTAQDKLNQASQDLASAQANQADTQKALSDADKALQDAKNVDASSSAKAQAQVLDKKQVFNVRKQDSSRLPRRQGDKAGA